MTFKQYMLKEEFPSLRRFLDKDEWKDAARRLKYDIRTNGTELYATKDTKFYGIYSLENAYIITNSKLDGFDSPKELIKAVKAKE